MRSVKVNFVLLLAVVLLAGGTSFSQFKAAPLRVDRSKLIEEIKAAKASKPGMKTAQLAVVANTLLEKYGINFAMLLPPDTCERIRKEKGGEIGATFKSVDAEGAALSLPEPVVPSSQSCECYTEIPALQVTDADFITVIMGRNIRFHLPSNLRTFAAILVDPTDHKIVKRRWRIPFRGTPIGVSHDENILYLSFDEPELFELSLAVFGEGVFQVVTRAEAEEGAKGRSIKATRLVSGEMKIQFDRWGKSLVVLYPPACS